VAVARVFAGALGAHEVPKRGATYQPRIATVKLCLSRKLLKTFK